MADENKTPRTSKKRKVYLSDDMKHKIAREMNSAKRKDRTKVASRYAVSPSAVRMWIRKGYGKSESTSSRGTKPKDATIENLLLRVVRDGLVAKSITIEEGARLLGLVYG